MVIMDRSRGAIEAFLNRTTMPHVPEEARAALGEPIAEKLLRANELPYAMLIFYQIEHSAE